MSELLRRKTERKKADMPSGSLSRLNVLDLQHYDLQPRVKRDAEYREGIASLAKDIQFNGLINPITVARIVSAESGTSQYIVIAGSRRVDAMRLLGINDIAANVYVFTTDDPDYQKKMYLLSDAENDKRDNLCPYENALVLYKMHTQFDMSVKDIAEYRSMSERSVQRYFSVLRKSDKLRPVLEYMGYSLYDITSIQHFVDLISLLRNKDIDGMKAYLQSLKNNDTIPEETEDSEAGEGSGTPVLKKQKKLSKNPKDGHFFIDMDRPHKLVIDGRYAAQKEYIEVFKRSASILKQWDEKGAFTQYLSDNPDTFEQAMNKMLNELYIDHSRNQSKGGQRPHDAESARKAK